MTIKVMPHKQTAQCKVESQNMKILLTLAGLSSALALTQNAVLREILVEVQYNRLYIIGDSKYI